MGWLMKIFDMKEFWQFFYYFCYISPYVFAVTVVVVWIKGKIGSKTMILLIGLYFLLIMEWVADLPPYVFVKLSELPWWFKNTMIPA